MKQKLIVRLEKIIRFTSNISSRRVWFLQVRENSGMNNIGRIFEFEIWGANFGVGMLFMRDLFSEFYNMYILKYN